MFSEIAIIGLGYIGLPTAVLLANHGIDVIGVDINPDIVTGVNCGVVSVVEPGLESMVKQIVRKGKLRACKTPQSAQAFIIAVPTPFGKEHEPDLSFVREAARSIALVLNKGNLVILESTSPVGTTEMISALFAELRPDLSFPQVDGEAADVQIAYCPERVLPGNILHELVYNDRVIGGITRYCAERASEVYKIFLKGECFLTQARTAELTKLTENSFRDVNVAFANELSLICEKLNIDVWELIDLANRHPRVNILQPGPGVGGHCIAVDPWFIVHSAPEVSDLIVAARRVNDSKPEHVIARVRDVISQRSHTTIACLGLAFKADIDDLRESPAVEIVSRLAQQEQSELLVVDPYISELPPCLQNYKKVTLTEMNEAVGKADVILVLVNHKQFYTIDLEQLSGKIIVDTRGILRSEAAFGQKRQRLGATSTSTSR